MYVVGITETCERLGVFSTLSDAEEFIGRLPDHAAGIYYIDGPCREIILAERFT